MLFDFDGTLADTLQDLAESMNHALAQFGRPAHPVGAHRAFIGDGVRDYCMKALGETRPDHPLVEELLPVYRATYQQRQLLHAHLYPEVPELLAELERRGVRMAILSNKPHANAVRMVKHLCPSVPFELIQGQVDHIPKKPDPAGAFHVAREMGLDPGAFLYLGDSNTDMRTARAAGMVAVGALWGFRDEAELLGAGAQTVIARPSQLLELL